MKWGCWGHWGHWGCWGHWGRWCCRGFKARITTTEDLRVIQVLEFNFILMFWKTIFLCRIMKSCWNLAPSLSEAVKASWCCFLKNGCGIQNTLYQHSRTIFKLAYIYPSLPIHKSHFNMRYPALTCRSIITGFALKRVTHITIEKYTLRTHKTFFSFLINIF